jgi:hypothetical protein
LLVGFLFENIGSGVVLHIIYSNRFLDNQYCVVLLEIMDFVQPTPEENEIVTALLERYEGENLPYKFTRTAALRFLRGRKGDVEKGYNAMIRHVRWRIESNVENINEEFFKTEVEKKKLVVAGVDKKGRPLVTVYARRHRKDERDLEQVRQYMIFSLERALQSSRPEEEKMTILFDLTGFGMYCMDYDAVKVLIDIMQYNYPETLSVAMIINSPFVFWACWAVIKIWLDPVTVAKVCFVNKNNLSDYVDPENFPQDLGVS